MTKKSEADATGIVTLKATKTVAKPRRAKVSGKVTAKVVKKSGTGTPKAAKPATTANVVLKKAEFIERAVDRTEIKKRDAKPAIEAALAVLADALMSGQEVNLPPMGKIKIVKSKDIGDGAQVLTLKLRTMKDGVGQGAKSRVADPDSAD